MRRRGSVTIVTNSFRSERAAQKGLGFRVRMGLHGQEGTYLARRFWALLTTIPPEL